MKRHWSTDIENAAKLSKHTSQGSTNIASANQAFRFHRTGIDAYSRHRELVNQYLLYRSGVQSLQRDRSRDQRDEDVIKNHHRFVWDEGENSSLTWEQRLAKRYYDKLFKEYCLSDMRYYKENKVGLRWRTEKEVVSGKGQFICGNKACEEEPQLKSWEVNFAYVEGGVKKNTLVKLRLCPACSTKLNHHKKHKQSEQPSHRRKEYVEEKKSDKLDVKPGTTSVEAPETSSENETSLWSEPVVLDEDKARSEDLDNYINDLLL